MLQRFLLLGLVVVASFVHLPAAQAEDAFAPTVSLGVFFEFGDEYGPTGGLEIWAGAAYYPSVDLDAEQTTGFLAAGLELRTGLIPILTGPNELSPQLRGGVVFLSGIGAEGIENETDNLSLSKAKLYGIIGYRWVSEFGLDNLEGKRKDEDAFRFGAGALFPVIFAYDIPLIDGAEFFADVNRDGTLDRSGFDVVLGF